MPIVDRSMVGGLWRTDANYKSALYLKNILATTELTVTPILYLSNGGQYTLADVRLQPEGIAVVDINASLRQQGIAPWATLSGYVEVKYKWAWDALCVTVRNADTLHSELFNFNLRSLLSIRWAESNCPAGRALVETGAQCQWIHFTDESLLQAAECEYNGEQRDQRANWPTLCYSCISRH